MKLLKDTLINRVDNNSYKYITSYTHEEWIFHNMKISMHHAMHSIIVNVRSSMGECIEKNIR